MHYYILLANPLPSESPTALTYLAVHFRTCTLVSDFECLVLENFGSLLSARSKVTLIKILLPSRWDSGISIALAWKV